MPRGKRSEGSAADSPKITKERELLAPINLKEQNSSPTLEGPATWEGGPAIIHQNVAVLEGVTETVLNEVLAGTDLKNMVVRRLSPTVIVVDQARVDEITKFLTKRGYEPKVIAG